MSDEVILNLSFDNQTVTDLTGNWTLDGTPNATYEQIDGRDGYSIVEGSLGRCIVLNAVDQNARYDEYTADFDMFVKSTYTSYYYGYYVYYLWSRKNPNIVGSFNGKIGEVLSISPQIGSSSPAGVTSYSPIGRWVHVTITSGPTGEIGLYHTAVYVDGVKLTERTDSGIGYDGNPFGISQRIIPCARDPEAFLMPNGPGVCLNTYKIVAGIHAPNQEPAISLLNLSRVFNNFCTWLKGQLSTVALTGSYNDLSDKPTISTVNDGTLTIQKNGTNVATFTANQSTAATANITVPTKTSDLTNDSGFITSDNTKIPLAGSNQISGSLIPATDNSIDIGSSTKNIKTLYTKGITIDGAQFSPSNYVPRVGGAVFSGTNFYRDTNDDGLTLGGGLGYLYGGTIVLAGPELPEVYRGRVALHPSLYGNIQSMQMYPSGTWTWSGTAVQLISDQRLKQQIAEIDDKLLDAWEDVDLVQFKYNDAVEQKGKDNARLHTGYVVQQIDTACKSHNVDISDYGLYCHEEYPEETEEVEVEQKDGTKVKETKVIREASEHYSLRYTEVYAVECMYLRRCIARLTARIEQLEKGKEQEASK